MDYNKISSFIFTDNSLYHLTYNDGTSEYLRLYVLRDAYANYPCITTNGSPNVHHPLPLYKANKLVGIIRKRTKKI